MRRRIHIATIGLLTLGVLAVVSGCGGGGGGGGGGTPPTPINITTTTLPNGAEGTAYSQTVATSGGQGARTWTISSGSLPAGLGLNGSTGVISGTPTAPGTANFTVRVADSTGSDTQDLSITIAAAAPPVITTTTLPNGTEGTAYSQTVQVTGGLAPFTWSITVGTLPAGLSLNASTGVISGTPTNSADDQTFTIRVQDSASTPGSDTQVLTININAPAPPVITTTTLPNATRGVAYNQTLALTGGVGPFTWIVSAGSLPANLGLSSSGVISGTPLCASTTQAFTVQVTDSASVPASDTQALSITVNAAAALSITTATPLPGGSVGSPYSQVIQATGGIPPYTFAVTAGTLPAGLGPITSGGQISGTPTTQETQNFDVRVTDSCGTQSTKSFALTISNTSLGRNDSSLTATVLVTGGNMQVNASISPFTDVNVTTPDQDFYQLTVNNNTTAVFDVTAANPPISSPMDPVIEIQDVNGVRLNTCRISSGSFNQPCMNDDRVTGNLDSRLEYNNTTGSTITIFLRVLDFRGDARPDLIYRVTITGAN